MPKSLDARHMISNRSYEMQRTNQFEVIINGLGDEFTLCVTRCALPEASITPVELAYGNSKVKVAGVIEYADGSIDCRDAILPDIEKKLLDWFYQVYNPETGAIGWKADYGKDILVNQYGPDGTYVRTWKLMGAWITTFTPGEMDVTNPDAKIISLTIAYDKAIRL